MTTQTLEIVNDGRYKVGQSYPFVKVDFTPSKGSFISLYLPWQDELNAIHIVVLKCIEHHKVRWDQAEDTEENRKHNGYVFQEEGGQKWHCQYPSASMGQTTTADGYIHREFIAEDYEKIKGDKEAVKRVFEHYEDIDDVLGGINRGLSELLKKDTLHMQRSLTEYKLKLLDQLAKDHGMYVIEQPWIVNFTNGNPPEVATYVTRTKIARISEYIPPDDPSYLIGDTYVLARRESTWSNREVPPIEIHLHPVTYAKKVLVRTDEGNVPVSHFIDGHGRVSLTRSLHEDVTKNFFHDFESGLETYQDIRAVMTTLVPTPGVPRDRERQEYLAMELAKKDIEERLGKLGMYFVKRPTFNFMCKDGELEATTTVDYAQPVYDLKKI